MPLYEYRCEDCGDVSEIIQKFSDRPLSKCEVCGGSLERLLSPPTIQFKGSGWYVTDYGRNNSRDSSAKDSSAKSKEKKTKKASDSKSSSKAKPSDPKN